MKDIYNIFKDIQILAFFEENNRIVYMNKYTEKLLLDSNPVVEYIMENLKENGSFDVIIKYNVYRLTRIRVGEGNLVIGIKISDLKEKEAHLRRENTQCVKRTEELLAYSDLIIHNVNNYIFMLDGYLSLMGEQSSESYVKKLRSIVENMRELVGRISLLFKSSESSLPLKERLNMKNLLDSAVDRIKDKAEKKGIVIHKNYSDLYVEVDPILVEVFLNLLDNAVKYSPRNSDVWIGVRNEKNSFIVRIKDNGPGISDDCKEVIFKRFMRRSTKQGMGLGLAIVKNLVDLNNGRVWVEDNEPQGCIFNVELPKK